MSIMEQTKYVFHLAQNIHSHLSKIYHNLGSSTDRERLKMLLEYMSQQEQIIKGCIEEYEKCLSGKVLNTWFKYVPTELEFDYTRILNLTPDMDIDDIISLALEVDDKLITMYSEMGEHCECESVKEAFANLKQLEQQKKKNLVRSYMRFEDL
jgi:hypothetical protein